MSDTKFKPGDRVRYAQDFVSWCTSGRTPKYRQKQLMARGTILGPDSDKVKRYMRDWAPTQHLVLVLMDGKRDVEEIHPDNLEHEISS